MSKSRQVHNPPTVHTVSTFVLHTVGLYSSYYQPALPDRISASSVLSIVLVGTGTVDYSRDSTANRVITGTHENNGGGSAFALQKDVTHTVLYIDYKCTREPALNFLSRDLFVVLTAVYIIIHPLYDEELAGAGCPARI